MPRICRSAGPTIHLVRRLASEAEVRPLPILITDPTAKPAAQFGAGLEYVQIDAFVLQRPPEPFNEHVVHPATASVDADPHPGIAQHVGAGELAALIRLEDFGPAEARQRFPQSLDAEYYVHRVRQPPGDHLARPSVHNGDKVEETPPHRQVRNVGTPDMARPHPRGDTGAVPSGGCRTRDDRETRRRSPPSVPA